MPADDAAVGEWLRYARRDLQAATVLVEAEDVDTVVAVAQLQQAIEKALKAFLLARGWELVKTHDLGYLQAEAVEHEGELEAYEEVCEIATKAYLEERYPGAGRSEIPRAMARELLEQGTELIDLLEDSAGGWSDMTDEEAERLRRETVEAFGTTRDDDPTDS